MTSATEFGLLLEQCATAAKRAAQPAEHVTVSVERVAEFKHRASTPARQTILLDEPVAIGGAGSAPDPAEHLLAAVGASLSVTLTAHAALRRIAIDGIHLNLKATMDGLAFFEPGRGTPGLVSCAIVLTIQSSASADALHALIDDAVSAAPVLCALKIVPRFEIRIEGAR